MRRVKSQSRKVRRLAEAALFGAVAATSTAYAQSIENQTITFDDLTDDGYGTSIANGYAGFDWDNFQVINSTDYFAEFGANGYTNGTVSSPNVAFDSYGSPASLAENNGSTFSLVSAYLTGAWNNGLQIEVDGYLDGTIVDTTTVTVNATGPTLETFDFDDIDTVVFTPSGGTPAGYYGNGEHFAMDNLTVTTVDYSLNWISPVSGLWDVAGNWDQDETPFSLNDVTIAPVNTLTVTGPAAPASVNSLTLGGNGNVTLALQPAGDLAVTNDLTILNGGSLVTSGANVSALSLSVDGTVTQSGPGLLSVASDETIGNNGAGVFIQCGGTNSVGEGLYLGNNAGSTGTYVLTGNGTLSAEYEYLGLNVGAGIFNQSGGTNTNYGLSIGGSYETTSSYTLSCGTLSVDGSEDIGYEGTGILNQSGGLNAIIFDNDLYLGYFSGVGTYNLSGGVLTSGGLFGGEYVGYTGTGIFNQSGGSNTINAGSLYVGFEGSGTYALSAGSLTVSGGEYVGYESGTGSIDQSGGINAVTGGSSLYVGYGQEGAGTTGAYCLSGTAVLTVSGSEFVGYEVAGTFNQCGGTNTVSGSLYVGDSGGSSGAFSLSGTGSLSVGGIEYVGYAGTGSINQSGGTNSAGALDVGEVNGSSGTYTLSGGMLSAPSGEYIGDFGAGTVNQSGGTNTVGPFFFLGFNGGSTGTYVLSGTGSLAAAGNEYVGLIGTGNFSQSGGTNTIGSNLYLGDAGESTGTYTLSGTGSLSAVGEAVGLGGTGIFNQCGGVNTVSNNLYIGDKTGSTGTYNLCGTGSLLVSNNEYVGENGTGTFNQNGGTNTVGSDLTIGDQAGATGNYFLSGSGSLTVQDYEYVGNQGTGTFTQSGGTNAIDYYLYVGEGGTGTYNLSAGSVLASDGEALGNGGNTGNFNQSGGTNATGFGLYVGYGGTGYYTLSGTGLLSTSGSQSVGYFGTGTFNQSGGTNMPYYIYVGSYSGSGTYDLSGTGTLSALYGEYVGSGGTGLFNQTGGTNSTEVLVVDSGSTYLFSAGSLSASVDEYVGESGVGTFSQSGGINTLHELDLGYYADGTGTYALSGTGSITTATNEYVGVSGTGIFNQSGGKNICQLLYIGEDSGSTGTYMLSGTGSLSSGNEFVGYGSVTGGYDGLTSGTFIQSGGANATGALNSLYIGYYYGAVGAYTLSAGTVNTSAVYLAFDSRSGLAPASQGWFSQSGGTLTAGTEYVGNGGVGGFNQSGGINNSSISFYLADSVGSTGTYTLSGNGSMTVSGNEYLGYRGLGFFNQSGGANTVSGGNSFHLGYSFGSTGTYTLSGTGALVVTGKEYVGYNGMGILNQSGGTNTINQSNALYLGFNSGATGTYNLSGTGALSAAGNEYVGYSSAGVFNQTGGTNALSGGGSLYLAYDSSNATGSYTLSGGLATVSGGVYVGGTNSAAIGPGVLTISNSGQLTDAGIMKVYTLGRVNINGGSASVGSLTISGNGIVNVNDALSINYGSAANDPISTIVGYLSSGYNGGTWVGTSGIISTNAAASVGHLPLFSVGYADGNTDVGTPAGPNQILVMYTVAGDANLDGNVNFDDLLTVAQNFNKTGEDWAGGNFNYNPTGLVNFGDLLIVAQNFNKTLPLGLSQPVGLSAGFISPVGSQTTAVPEPSAMAMAVCAGAGLLARRRRKCLTPSNTVV